jgi:hypothetical protein
VDSIKDERLAQVLFGMCSKGSGIPFFLKSGPILARFFLNAGYILSTLPSPLNL